MSKSSDGYKVSFWDKFKHWVRKHTVLTIVIAVVLVLVIAFAASGGSLGGSSSDVPTPEESLKSALNLGSSDSVSIAAPNEEQDFGGWIDVYYEDTPFNMEQHIASAVKAWGKMNTTYGTYGLTVHFNEESVDSFGNATQREYGYIVFQADTLAGLDTSNADSLMYRDSADYIDIDEEYESYVS